MTTMGLSIAGFFLVLILLVLWGVVFWKKPRLGWGIAVGVGLAYVFAAVARSYEGHEMPVWLPALPFALVALTLLVFGVLAWYWGREE